MDQAVPTDREDEPEDFLRGWQRRAARACDERATALASWAACCAGLHRPSHVGRIHRAQSALPGSAPSPLAPAGATRSQRLFLPWHVGRHGAACAVSGVLASRALHLERAVARVCQEAGARVGRNVRLAAMNLHVPVHDARHIEVICNGLALWHGSQVAVDATIVSPDARDGAPRPRAASGKHRQTYPELSRSRRCRLVVFGVEVGGRWATEAASFLRMLARVRAASAPPALCPTAQNAWVQRWSGIISVAAQGALAASVRAPAKPMSVLPDLSRLCTSSSRMPVGSRARP